MRCLATAVVVLAIATAPVRADTESQPGEPLARIRELYERGDFVGVRRELLLQYEASPDPALLFALGQVELNLGNYAAAITYYERFIASGPSDKQIALAQQAIGAARMRLAQPVQLDAPRPRVDEPAVPQPRRRWLTEDTGLAALGGTALLVGAGLAVYAQRLGSDRTGTLSDYDARLDRARATAWTGAGLVTAGALLVGVTVLRWRLRPDGTSDVTAGVSAGGISVSGRW